LKVHRYELDTASLLNASGTPSNLNYRMTEGNGIVPLAAGYQGAPFYASLPHFWQADASIQVLPQVSCKEVW
jgi:hypothetical protein